LDFTHIRNSATQFFTLFSVSGSTGAQTQGDIKKRRHKDIGGGARNG
jgi:hypothetical protein